MTLPPADEIASIERESIESSTNEPLTFMDLQNGRTYAIFDTAAFDHRINGRPDALVAYKIACSLFDVGQNILIFVIETLVGS